MKKKSFEMITDKDHPERVGIKCLRCGRVSWNPNDVRQLYCDACGRFHDDDAR